MSPGAALWSGVRVVALRSPRVNPVDSGPGLFVLLTVAYCAAAIALAMLDVERPWAIVPFGVMTVLTDSLLTLFAAWMLARIMDRGEIVWGVAAVLLAATIMTSILVHAPLAWLASKLAAGEYLAFALLAELVSRIWWLLVLVVVAHWLAPASVARAFFAAVLGYAVSAAIWWWLPAMPVLMTAADEPTRPIVATDPPGAVADDDDDDATAPAFDAEAVIYNQRTLLDAATAKLKPQTPGVVDLYVVVFAGDAEENVFRNEAEYAEKLFSQRFGAEGRVIVLENNVASVATRPLATLTNLAWALDDVANAMDPTEDLLLVYVTTHGSADHELLVDLAPLPLNQIGPDDLADALATKPGVRWKVVVVNACYSGGFVDALRDDSTLVITSARADRTSFGCGAGSDVTYFGKAFLTEALNRTTSFPDAFARAKKSVAEWEDRDKEEHSEPQIATTRSIEAKLATWERTLKPGPPVPFAPAAAVGN
ncbi:MAG: C13 family peptidase [Rhodanobacteraceae bacterium]